MLNRRHDPQDLGCFGAGLAIGVGRALRIAAERGPGEVIHHRDTENTEKTTAKSLQHGASHEQLLLWFSLCSLRLCGPITYPRSPPAAVTPPRSGPACASYRSCSGLPPDRL